MAPPVWWGSSTLKVPAAVGRPGRSLPGRHGAVSYSEASGRLGQKKNLMDSSSAELGPDDLGINTPWAPPFPAPTSIVYSYALPPYYFAQRALYV